MGWATERPLDLDLHVVSVKKDDHTTVCRTYWEGATYFNPGKCLNGDMNGRTGCCPDAGLELDTDNRGGGLNGSETVTLGPKSINKGAILS